MALGAVMVAYSSPVSEEMARNVASGFLTKSTVAKSILEGRTVDDLEQREAIWIAHLSPRGYIIVAGSDKCRPIISFSSNDFVEPEECSPFAEKLAFDSFRCQTAEADETLETDLDWAKYFVNDNSSSKRRLLGAPTGTTTRVVPLLQSAWDQYVPYNDLTPLDCPCGCIATANAQEIRYWQWPHRMEYDRTYTHSLANHGNHTIRVNGFVPFEYSKMAANYNDAVNLTNKVNRYECSHLILWMQSLVRMSFASQSTSADFLTAQLMNGWYENGSSVWTYVKNAEWDDVKADLDFGSPLQLRIILPFGNKQNISGGHQVVIDGYAIGDESSEVYINFNYGWSNGEDWNRWDDLKNNGNDSNCIQLGFRPKKRVQFDIVPKVSTNSVRLVWYLPPCYTNRIDGFERIVSDGVTPSVVTNIVETGNTAKVYTDVVDISSLSGDVTFTVTPIMKAGEGEGIPTSVTTTIGVPKDMPVIESVSAIEGVHGLIQDGFFAECYMGITNVLTVICSEATTALQALPSHLSVLPDEKVRVVSNGGGVFTVSLDATEMNTDWDNDMILLTLVAENGDGTKVYKNLMLRYHAKWSPVAVWSGDLNIKARGYDLQFNGNELSEDGSTITITNNVGVKVDFSAGFTSAMTVMFRYSDLSFDSQKTLATSFCSGKDENRTGVYLATGGTANGIWNTDNWKNPMETLSESSGTLAFCYSKNGGTRLYYVGADGVKTIYSRSDLKAAGDPTINGCTIGGEREKEGATLLSAATGMKITGVAIFDRVLDDIAMLDFVWSNHKGISIKSRSSVSEINAMIVEAGAYVEKIVLDVEDGATIEVDEAFEDAIPVSVVSDGNVRLSADAQPATSCFANVDFSGVKGGLLRSWLTPGVVGFNFCSDDGDDCSGGLVAGEWFSNSSDRNGTADVLFSDGLSTLTWSSATNWQYAGTSMLSGYLDDGINKGHGAEITLSNVPYDYYDVIIYASSDSAGAGFLAKTVNGNTYTFDTNTCAVVADTNIWGQTRYPVPKYGENALRIRNLSGPLTIYGGVKGDGGDLERGGIAAFQIMPTNALESCYSCVLSGAEWSKSDWRNYQTDSLLDFVPTNGFFEIVANDDVELTVDTDVAISELTVSGDGKVVFNVMPGVTFAVYGKLQSDALTFIGGGRVFCGAGDTLNGTIKGSCIIEYAEGILPDESAVFTNEEWTGTNVFTNCGHSNNIAHAYVDLSVLGNDNSFLKMPGYNGYLDNDMTCCATLIVDEGTVFNISNGDSTHYNIFKKVVGSGKIIISGNTTSTFQTVVRDVSGFTGEIQVLGEGHKGIVVGAPENWSFDYENYQQKVAVAGHVTIASGKTWDVTDSLGVVVLGSGILEFSDTGKSPAISGLLTLTNSATIKLPADAAFPYNLATRGSMADDGSVRFYVGELDCTDSLEFDNATLYCVAGVSVTDGDTTKFYPTLSNAVEAASAEVTNTVRLLSNESGVVNLSDKTIVFNANEYDFTGTFSGSGRLIVADGTIVAVADGKIWNLAGGIFVNGTLALVGYGRVIGDVDMAEGALLDISAMTTNETAAITGALTLSDGAILKLPVCAEFPYAVASSGSGHVSTVLVGGVPLGTSATLVDGKIIPDVASITVDDVTSYYTSLAAATNAANGNVITLLTNTDEVMVIPAGQTVRIQNNGFTCAKVSIASQSANSSIITDDKGITTYTSVVAKAAVIGDTTTYYYPSLSNAVEVASSEVTNIVRLLEADSSDILLNDKTIIFEENGFAFSGTLTGNGTLIITNAPSATTWLAERFDANGWNGTFVLKIAEGKTWSVANGLDVLSSGTLCVDGSGAVEGGLTFAVGSTVRYVGEPSAAESIPLISADSFTGVENATLDGLEGYYLEVVDGVLYASMVPEPIDTDLAAIYGPQAIAVWDGNFSTNALVAYSPDYTLVNSNATHGLRISSVTVDQDNQGLLFDSANAMSGITVLVRYSNLTNDTANNRVLFTSSVTSSNYYDRAGIQLKSDGTLVGLWNSSTASNNNTDYGTATNSIPSSGVMAFTYSTAGTYLYYGATAKNIQDDPVWGSSGLKSSNDTAIYGAGIGGMYRGGSKSGAEAAKGMTIEAVAVFNKVLTVNDMNDYIWPSYEIVTINVSGETSVSQLNFSIADSMADAAVVDVADGTAIVVDEAFTSMVPVSMRSDGKFTLSSESQPPASWFANVDLSGVKGALLRSWLPETGVVGFNFNSAKGSVDSVAIVPGGTWIHNSSDKSGTSTNLFADGLSKISWSSATLWQCGASSILDGYLDDGANDGNGAEIRVERVPYETYDVIIYVATDSGSSFLAKTVNGTSYTWSVESNAVVKGTSVWGATKQLNAVYGTNAMRIRNLSGPLTIYGGARADNYRGGIAAIQIMPHHESAIRFEAGSHGTLSGEAEQTIDYGDKAAVPSVTPSAGWNFDGWNGDTNAAVFSNATYTAQYTPIEYAIMYNDVKGADNSANPITYTVTNSIVFEALANVDGWDFSNWDPGSIANGSMGDVSVTAKWNRVYHDIVITNVVDGTTMTTNVEYGAQVTFTAPEPKVEGGVKIIYAGSSHYPEAGTYITVMANSNISFAWDILATNYMYATSATSDGYIEGAPADGWLPYGTNFTLTAVASNNYHFVEWTGNTDNCFIDDDEINVVMDEARTIGAAFAINTYTVTFVLDEKGSHTGGGELIQTIPHGSAAVAPVVEPNAGWTFNGWSAEFDCITSDLTVTAMWNRVYHNIVITNPDGTTTTNTVEYGSSTTFYAPASVEADGVQIVYVGTNYSPESGTNVTVIATENVNFTWDILATNYWFKSSVMGGGSISGAPDDGWLPDGTNFTITANADANYVFSGWTSNGVDAASGTSLNVTMDGPRMIIADFKATTDYMISPKANWFTEDATVVPLPQTSEASIGGGTIDDGALVVDSEHGLPIFYYPPVFSGSATTYRVETVIKDLTVNVSTNYLPIFTEEGNVPYASLAAAYNVDTNYWFGWDRADSKWQQLGCSHPVDGWLYTNAVEFVVSNNELVVSYYVNDAKIGEIKNYNETSLPPLTKLGFSGYGKFRRFSGEGIEASLTLITTKSLDELIDAGLVTNGFETVESAFAYKDETGLYNWQKLALGMSTDSKTKPYVAPVQNSSPGSLSFKVGNCKEAHVFEGKSAKFEVFEVTSNGSEVESGLKSDKMAVGKDAAIIDLSQSSGVRYFKIKIVFE